MRVAYLHGFLGAPGVWDVIARPGDRALALPGHGGGPVLATWDANLEAVADEIGTCDVVVGYSLGARVALGLVARGLVPRAVLISVNPGIDDAERPARRAADAAWARMLRTEGLPAFLDAWEAQPLFASQARVSPGKRAARRTERLAHDPEQLARSLEIMGLAAMPDYRGAFDARCSLIVGGDDAKFVALARALSPDAVEIAGCGHDPLFERPERSSELISAQIEHHLAPSARS